MATMDDLPGNLLLRIVSFLPIRDAVRTSVLSPKWKNLWSSLSSLDFDYTLFPPKNSFQESRQVFVDFVNQTLIGRSRTRMSPLHKFRLTFFFDKTETDYYYNVVSWIRYAISHQAVELYLDFHGYWDFCELDAEGYYDFRLSAIRSSCVRVLNLHDCCIRLPPSVYTTGILSLQSMFLRRISLTDDIVSGLMSECVNLESLVIEDCSGMENLKIHSSKLKELTLRYIYYADKEVDSVEICAPNLGSISIIRFEMDKFSLKNSSSLVEAHVSYPMKHFHYWSIVVRLLSGVKRLTTPNMWFEMVFAVTVLNDKNGPSYKGG